MKVESEIEEVSGQTVNQTNCNELQKYIGDLFNNPLYSDLIIQVNEDHVIYAHKVILSYRTNIWNGVDIKNIDSIYITDMKYELVYLILKWVYTDKIDEENLTEDELLDLLQLAAKLQLEPLFSKCENKLMSIVDASNYEKLHHVAEKVCAENLEDVCQNMKKKSEKLTEENCDEYTNIVGDTSLDTDTDYTDGFDNGPELSYNNNSASKSRASKVKNVSITPKILKLTKSSKRKGQENFKNRTLSLGNDDQIVGEKFETEHDVNSNTESIDSDNDTKLVNAMPQTEAQVHSELKCPVCFKSYQTKRKLNEHQRVHNRVQIFKCEICEKPFYSIGHYKQHLVVHTEIRPFQCEVCGATFRQSAGLYSHSSIHTGIKPYKCDQCSKTFRTKHSLQTHERVHSGEKPFICHFCGKGFTSNSHFRRHQNVVHTGEKRYQCDVCQKCFHYNHHVKRHKKLHTDGKL